MGKGQATGINRKYEEYARDVITRLRRQDGDWVPYARDGVGVPIQFAGTEVCFDVALTDGRGRVLVVECRRRQDTIQQEAVLALWGKIALLRAALQVEVAGIFVAKTRFAEGAHKLAAYLGIEN